MKDIMSRTIAFLTFDSLLQPQQISLQFSETHHKRQAEINEWSTNATRQQLVSYYWYTHVISHFSVLFGLPASILFLLLGQFSQPGIYLISAFIVCPIVYLALYLFQYRPKFNSIYLPQLETVKEAKNVGKPSYLIFHWHFSFMS
jgi:hypothetical protein